MGTALSLTVRMSAKGRTPAFHDVGGAGHPNVVLSAWKASAVHMPMSPPCHAHTTWNGFGRRHDVLGHRTESCTIIAVRALGGTNTPSEKGFASPTQSHGESPGEPHKPSKDEFCVHCDMETHWKDALQNWNGHAHSRCEKQRAPTGRRETWRRGNPERIDAVWIIWGSPSHHT